MAADVLKTPSCVEDSNCSLSRHESVCKTNGPFRATQIWNEIIENLKCQVEVKRRKVHMKSYNHCFTGTDAVDVVLHQLLTDKTSFPNQDITREKAVKLCQYMLEQNIFESVRHSKQEDGPSFEDSPSKLYRFLEQENNDLAGVQRCMNCQELSKPDTDTVQKELAPPSSVKSIHSASSASSLHRHHGVVQELLELTGTWSRRNSDCMKRKLTPARLFTVTGGDGPRPSGRLSSGRLSFPGVGTMSGLQDGSDDMDGLEKLTPEVEDELMREVALSQLLTLLDIPVLDSILSYDSDSTRHTTTKQRSYSNMAFRRCESVISLFSNTSDKDDAWWDAALDCVECLPKGLDMLDISLTEKSDLTQKLRMYQSIVDHYTDLPDPLWSDKFVDVHLGLYNLLMQSKRDLVLKGLQLSIVLLPCDIKEEIKRLLKFLHRAAEEDAVSLSSMESNRAVIERVFSPVFIRNKLLAPHQSGQLVLCMVDYADKIWDVPPEVDEAVRQRLLELQEGRGEKVPLAKSYCHQISEAEFRKQQEECTEHALVDLMNAILDDTKLTLKDKKQRLKHLQKQHPKIYWKHFSDML